MATKNNNMIHPEHLHIGSLLRTNKGEIIKVESISTKRQHRKVGYHTTDNHDRIKYVRLAQCELVETPITPELLDANGWSLSKYANEFLLEPIPDYAIIRKDDWIAQYKFGRNTLCIWKEYDGKYSDITDPDISFRVCPTTEKLAMAFALADIDYELKTE